MAASPLGEENCHGSRERRVRPVVFSTPAFQGRDYSTHLPRRPAEWSPAQYVQMQVKDTLARVASDVPDETIATLGDALSLRHGVRHAHHRRQHRPIRRLRRVDARDVSARDHQHMQRRLGIQIAEGNHLVVAIDLRARKRPSDDAAEDTGEVGRSIRSIHRGESSFSTYANTSSR